MVQYISICLIRQHVAHRPLLLIRMRDRDSTPTSAVRKTEGVFVLRQPFDHPSQSGHHAHLETSASTFLDFHMAPAESVPTCSPTGPLQEALTSSISVLCR